MATQGVPIHKRDGLVQSGIMSYCIKRRNYMGGGLWEPVLDISNLESETQGQGLDQLNKKDKGLYTGTVQQYVQIYEVN